MREVDMVSSSCLLCRRVERLVAWIRPELEKTALAGSPRNKGRKKPLEETASRLVASAREAC